MQSGSEPQQPIRPREIRAANAELVLGALADANAATRAELAARVSLSVQALGPILAELVEAGRVIEEPSERSGPGRPPAAFRLDPLGRCNIELVIQFADHYIIVRDAFGQLLQVKRARHTPGPTPKRLVGSAARSMQKIVGLLGVTIETTTPLAIIVEGTVDEDHQLVVETPAWKATNIELGPMFAAALGENVTVTVTSNERALAVRALEVVDPSPADLVVILQISHQTRFLMAKEGVIADNRTGSTGLLSHFPVAGNERACECGRVGCLGTVSSGAAVVRNYYELTGQQLPAAIEVIDRIGDGDPNAIEAARRSTEWLCVALAPFLRMMRPDRLIVTGAVGRAGSRGAAALSEALRASFDQDMDGLPIDVVQPDFVTATDSLANVLLR